MTRIRPRALAVLCAAVIAAGVGLSPAQATDNLGDPHWHKLGTDPVSYHIHTSLGGGPDGLAIAGAINAGAAEWTNKTNWDLAYAGSTSGTVNYDDRTTRIVWAGNIPSNWQNGCPPASTVACARWTYVVDFGVPHNIDSDFVYNSASGPWSTDNLNCDLGSFAAYDFWTLAIHEFGHWATLAHSSDILAVMYDSYTICKRAVTQHDINSANARYAGH